MEAVVYFQHPDNCIHYLATHRWIDGEPVCPTCGSKDIGFINSRRLFQCRTRHPKAQFSVKLGTIFENSPLGLDKWLPTMWLIASNRNGISSWELHRAIKVTQKTAWFMLHRIRLAMQDDLSGGTLGGEVEVDETFIGGKARNMHKDRKRRVQQHGRNTGGKAVVLGMLQRDGKVIASVVPDRTNASIQPIVRGSVDVGTTIYSDEHGHQWKMEEYEHEIVNHLMTYVSGNVHTNGIENFWSLLKRTIVEPFHLFRYVDEQAFRFNNRLPVSDKDRFSYLVRKIVGKRLTYAELTGKVGEKQGSTKEPF